MGNILKGIIPPVVTPLLDDGVTLDEVGLQNIIEHLVKGGVHGLFMLGTTGEGSSLSYDLRKQLLAKTQEFVAGRIPVLAGVTDTSLEGTLEISNFAKSIGIDAVVIAPPYYLPISEKEFVNFLEDFIRQTDIPFVLYNMPSCTKMHMSLDLVEQAHRLGAIGVKDSSGDMNYLYSLIDRYKHDDNFSVLVGTELFLPEAVLNGGDGAVAGGANMFPELFVELYEAAKNNDRGKVKVLRDKVLWLYKTIYNVGDDTSRFVKNTKTVLMAMGVCNNQVASPLYRSKKEEISKLEEYLKEYNSGLVTNGES
ncbi:MAG: dihydrodipicolinate synthase family protein [Bacteroidota bacterium]